MFYINSALTTWLPKVSIVLDFSHFVSLISSPVTLVGFTLMTAEKFEREHWALNLWYLSWDVVGTEYQKPFIAFMYSLS